MGLARSSADDTGVFQLLLSSTSRASPRRPGGTDGSSCPRATQGVLQTTWHYAVYKAEAGRKGGTFNVRAFCLPKSLLRVTDPCLPVGSRKEFLFLLYQLNCLYSQSMSFPTVGILPPSHQGERGSSHVLLLLPAGLNYRYSQYHFSAPSRSYPDD